MRYIPKQQRGMTGIALAVSISILIFFIWLALVLFPIYYENFKVGSHLSSLARDNDINAMTDADLVEALMRTYSVDDVENVHSEDIAVMRTTENVTVTIEYEVRKKIIGNIDVVVNFLDEEKFRI